MPLQPRLREACRLCQLMHVLSFGEGRKLKLCFVFNGEIGISTSPHRYFAIALPKQLDTFRGFCHANVEYARDIDVEACELVMYLAPPRPFYRQWFKRRFDLLESCSSCLVHSLFPSSVS